MSRISFPRPVTGTATVLNLAAGLLLLALMFLTVADVVGRSVFGQSVLGTVDISTLLLVTIAFLGLASAEIDGKHVSVTLVEARFGHRSRMVLSGIRAVLLLVLGSLIVWGMGEVLLSAYDRGETTNDILRLATWPAKLVLFLSFLLFFVMAVWKEVLEFRTFRSGEVPQDNEVDAAIERAHSAVRQEVGEVAS
ncbi:MAG TPA: TRAP transporter small permease [Nocardiopsis listeri]|uniref:TRAP transporter small permease subunit n=1 Tax=Nocardiopsis listeri TaxID=53440 RepID=UPI001D615E32|nr:TRAP transporter small permease [Nocardiopsis listeri]HJE57979.1 TRAP transporter small permease [Nocardiopsis listeri]